MSTLNGKHQYGRDSMSHDYHAHVSRMARMPTLLTDVPPYPNVHRAFNNSVVYEEETFKQVEDQAPEGHKKVHFVEEVTECDEKNGEFEVYNENIDVEADGYIQQRRKNFELCRWKTFKMH